jgi:hypothetical protein
MTLLTTHGLPFPEPDDPPNGPAQIQDLAEAADLKLLTVAKSIIATEESRSNGTAGLMTTPDSVSLTVPSVDCLILLSFVCDIKESVQNTARLNMWVSHNSGNFVRLPVNPGTALTANTYGGFFTSATGLSAFAGDFPGAWTLTVPSADPSLKSLTAPRWLAPGLFL